MNSLDDKAQYGLRLPPSPGLQARNENASAAHTKRTPEHSQEGLLLREPEPFAQNDSVRAASVAQADSLERYADLFEFAPIAYLTLNG
ncbi:MAG TPA: hypothetical protein VIF60_02460 [Burkholderiaceae bacterium]|jgi:hypothetical protein